MDDLMLAVANKYGVLAVVAYLVMRSVVSYVKGKFFPPKAAPAPIPGVPTDTPPVAPPAEPLLLSAVRALYASLGHPEPDNLDQVHPGVLGRLRDEILGRLGLAATPTAPAPAPLNRP